MLVTLLLLFTACEGGKMSEKIVHNDSNYAISETEMKKIAEKKIYFGHQSVGYNILDGINDILKQNPGVKLNIVESNDPNIFNKPVFAHSSIVQNDNPELKVNDFVNYIKKGIGNNADIAFFKFCYVDINNTTDVERIFSVYKETMERLKREYPKTKFIHVTVPLTVSNPTIKSFIKKLIGKQDNNLKRNQFNDKLLKEYDGKDPIFDLARAESTYPDGNRVSFTDGEKRYYSLAPEYTDDGGHLNERGRKVVARELLKFLSNIEIK